MNRWVIAAIVLALILAACGHACFAAEYTVGAYYYPWYGDGNFHGGANTCIRWHLAPQQQPSLGWYNSHDPGAVSAHLLWARSAGIDFFVCSYWGSGDDTAWTIKNRMLSNPDIGNMKICVMFEPIITASNAAAETAYLCDNFFTDPHYYRIGGKPVIYLYATRAFSDSDLTSFVNNIRNTARSKGAGEVYLVADEVKASPNLWDQIGGRAGKFDAITDYDVYGSMKILGANPPYATTSNLDSWKSANDSWRTVAHSNGARFFPGVTPGFNDTAVRAGNAPMSRKLTSDANTEGSLFSAIIDKAKLNCDDNTVLVTSWNEWHEDTQIEPVAPAAPTNAVDGTGGALTNGVNYTGYAGTYLDILRSRTSDVPAPPADPSVVGATGISPNSIRWTWSDNSSNETGFNVYAEPGSGPLVATLAGTTGAGVAYFDYTGLIPDTLYACQVTAANGASQSLRTPCVTAVTLAAAPAQGSNIACDRTVGAVYAAATTFTFSNPAGFGVSGPSRVTSFACVWDTSSTHIWAGSESVWDTGALAQIAGPSGSYYLHVRSLNQSGVANPASLDYGPFHVDGTAPTSAGDKESGVYRSPLTVVLSADEPATIHYTVDGAEPTTSSPVYGSPLSLSADTTLKFFAVDAVGNAEPVKHTSTYKLITTDGSIDYVKTLPKNTAIRLGDKYLFWKSGSIGFIEEPDRTGAIRVNGLNGLLLPSPARVCLTGYLRRPSAYEYAIDVEMITPSGPMALRPLGMHISPAKPKELGGYYLRNWGTVKPGSVSGNSFVLVDPTDAAGIAVDTSYAAGIPVTGGEFVTITGARAFTPTGLPILYAFQILHY